MNRSAEQALTSLLPTHSGPIPGPLVELATSLLAQSRSRASNLKAEEEIARSYACANIACERLKRTLNLPKIDPRPPCPPRVYNKLYEHLDAALSRAVRTATTRESDTNGKSPPVTPSKRVLPPSTTTPTPSRLRANPPLAPSATTSSRLPRNRRPATISATAKVRLQKSTDDPRLPKWLMPLIRHLLSSKIPLPTASYGDPASTPTTDHVPESAPLLTRLAPHIFTACCTMLTQPSPSLPSVATTESSSKRDKIPALVIAVFFFCWTRGRGRDTGTEVYRGMRDGCVANLRAYLENRDEEIKEWGRSDVDAWVREIGEKGWLRAAWFSEVREGCLNEAVVEKGGLSDDDTATGSDGDNEDGTDVMRRRARLEPSEDEGVEIGGRETLWPGLGTMMQERVDWLSEEKRDGYEAWERDVLMRVEAMERRTGKV